MKWMKLYEDFDNFYQETDDFYDITPIEIVLEVFPTMLPVILTLAPKFESVVAFTPPLVTRLAPETLPTILNKPVV